MGRNAAITVAVGIAIWVWGTLFRVMHWPFAALIRNAAYMVMATGAVLLIIAAIKNKGLAGLLDSTDPDANDL